MFNKTEIIDEILLDYAKENKIILETCRRKEKLPVSLLEKAAKRKDVFITVDMQGCAGLEIFYKGISHLKEYLLDNKMFAMKKEITGRNSSITYDELLKIKEEYTKIYKEKFEKHEDRVSKIGFYQFEDEIDNQNFRHEIKEAAEESMKIYFLEKMKNKKTKKYKIGQK